MQFDVLGFDNNSDDKTDTRLFMFNIKLLQEAIRLV